MKKVKIMKANFRFSFKYVRSKVKDREGLIGMKKKINDHIFEVELKSI